MQIIEGLTDAEIAEAHRSAGIFAEVEEMTAPLDALLSLIHALDWLNIKEKADKDVLKIFFDGQFGDPLAIAMGKAEPDTKREDGQRFAALLAQARDLIHEEHFLNWQVTFPGIWSGWEEEQLQGGFDARDRQSSLGPDEASTGRVVCGAAARDRLGPTRRRP